MTNSRTPALTMRTRGGRMWLWWSALAAVLVCSGCPDVAKSITAVEAGDDVVFQVAEVDEALADGEGAVLLDLTVQRKDCNQDCTMWFVVRSPGEPGAGRLRSARIVYGQPLPGMTARRPGKPLTPGTYSVGATLQRVGPDGELHESIMLDGAFALEEDGSGKGRVRDATGGK